MTPKELLNVDSFGEFVGLREMMLLPAEEAPTERIPSLEKIADVENDIALALDATCLLAAWGSKRHVDRLKQYCEQRVDLEKNFHPHRLRNYDQIYENFLAALISYWLWFDEYDDEKAEEARTYIYPVVILIVQLANHCQFELDRLYSAIKNRHWIEYLPHIKSHFEALFHSPNQHQWKFVDTINFLDQYDKNFVSEVLIRNGKSRVDFPLER